MTKINVILFSIIILIILSCESSSEPKIKQKLLVSDASQLIYNIDFLNSSWVLDIDYIFIYHYENTNGKIVEYKYFLDHIDHGFDTECGYIFRFDETI